MHEMVRPLNGARETDISHTYLRYISDVIILYLIYRTYGVFSY